ncbi:MAG: hypothetical protein ACM3VZ_09495 [Acidobacteriota bacterium]
MNWFDNVSSDCDQPIAPARLMQGHWRHRLHPFADPVLCRVVMDVAEPRVVAAQVIEDGMVEDLDSSTLEELTQAMVALDVHLQPTAWGLSHSPLLPTWAKPSFSESQIEELQRIEGYLIEASEENFESVLQLRDEFLRGIGLTDRHMYRAVRDPQSGPAARKSGRMLIN